MPNDFCLNYITIDMSVHQNPVYNPSIVPLPVAEPTNMCGRVVTAFLFFYGVVFAMIGLLDEKALFFLYVGIYLLAMAWFGGFGLYFVSERMPVESYLCFYMQAFGVFAFFVYVVVWITVSF